MRQQCQHHATTRARFVEHKKEVTKTPEAPPNGHRRSFRKHPKETLILPLGGLIRPPSGEQGPPISEKSSNHEINLPASTKWT